MLPPPKLTPDEWGAENRHYPPSAGKPGPRDPHLTPYVIDIGRAAADGDGSRVVAAMAAQMGKTDLELDVVGQRLDQRPVPILWVGPTKDFLTDQFEPRLMSLLEEAPRLAAKLQRGKRTKKLKKMVAGVALRLAHGGSSAALKSDPAGLAIVDEYDEMLANVKGQGDPLGLIEARGYTYADFMAVISSTPSKGHVETEIDPVSGLEFWKVADIEKLESAIWKLFQEGTRYHWAWPCAHCDEFFIPRFKCLLMPKNPTPAQARRGTVMVCPNCGGILEDAKHKAAMNARGLYIAPGQTIVNGRVEGAPIDTSTISFWVSGLASPFVTWGERAENLLKAQESGEEDKIQTAMNAGFGECYLLGGTGETPPWQEVMAKQQPYRQYEAPREAIVFVAAVDVQKYSLIYVIRGFGARGTSWLVDFGAIPGPTAADGVWDELETLITAPIDGKHLHCAFIDSGFRPNKTGAGDEHKVYEFAAKWRNFVFPTKGHDTQSTPIKPAKIEVNHKGKRVKTSITLMHLDTDFFKSLVHSRIRIEAGKAGSFYVPGGMAEPDGAIIGGITEDYARQVVSEGRIVNKTTGKAQWVALRADNHFLDCEAMAAAAGYMLRVHAIADGTVRPANDGADLPAASIPAAKPMPNGEGGATKPDRPARVALPAPVQPAAKSDMPMPPRVRQSPWLGGGRGSGRSDR